jgi:hypothetical protein
MTEVTYYQCTTYLNEEWFFSDGSVETATFSASAIGTTSAAETTQRSYDLAFIQATEYLILNYSDRIYARCITNIKRDLNVNFGVIPDPTSISK